LDEFTIINHDNYQAHHGCPGLVFIISGLLVTLVSEELFVGNIYSKFEFNSYRTFMSLNMILEYSTKTLMRMPQQHKMGSNAK